MGEREGIGAEQSWVRFLYGAQGAYGDPLPSRIDVVARLWPAGLLYADPG